VQAASRKMEGGGELGGENWVRYRVLVCDELGRFGAINDSGSAAKGAANGAGDDRDGEAGCSAGRREVLEAARWCLQQYAEQWTKRYMFAVYGMHLEVDEEQDCLVGYTQFCDAMLDEWLIVFILKEMTRVFDGLLMATVEDNDGQFLLIEGAEFLPEWVSPENSEGRVFLYKGRLHLVDIDNVSEAEVTLERCSSFVASHSHDTVASESLEHAVWEHYVSKISQKTLGENTHRVSCLLPRRIATLLSNRPQVTALAAHEFHHADLGQLNQFHTAFNVPNSESWDLVQIALPRTAFAQLSFKSLAISEHLATLDAIKAAQQQPETSPVHAQVELGTKLACGVHLLNSKAVHESTSPFLPPKQTLPQLECVGHEHPLLCQFDLNEVQLFAGRYVLQQVDQIELGELVSTALDFTLPEPPACNVSPPNVPDDSAEWLKVTPDELDDALAEFSSTEKSNGSPHPNQAPERVVSMEESNLQDMMQAMQALMESESGVDGIDNKPKVKTTANLDIDKLLDLLRGEEDAIDEVSQASSSSQSKHSATESEAASDVEEAEAFAGALASEMDGQLAKEMTDYTDTVRPVHVDQNLVENLINAALGQAASAGPTTTLMHQLRQAPGSEPSTAHQKT